MSDQPLTVFISYARADDHLTPIDPSAAHTYHHDPAHSFTHQLYDGLVAAGFNVWWDREAMPNRGLTFLEEIREAVSHADYLVYVSGAAAAKSDYVKAEWEYAHKVCKPIIPILRNGDFKDIPAPISMGHAPDFRDMAFFTPKLAELVRMLKVERRPLATLYKVPNLPDWYIEREGITDDLRLALQQDAHKPIVVTSKGQTVALQGMGGLGKTTLASALCHRCDVRHSFPDGVFWLEMGKTPSVAVRQADIGVELGDERGEYPDEQRGKSRLSALLRDKRALLVLDDVWDYKVVEAFRVEAPQCRILVTTRSQRISTQLGVTQHSLETLSAEEGVALLAKRVGATLNGYSADARAIVEMLGGHTLAISIAAAKIGEGGVADLPRFRQRLESRRAKGGSPLGDLNMQDDDKNYNLELSLSESIVDLKPHEQAWFRALGAMAPDSTFDVAAVQALWQAEDRYTVEDGLRTLSKLSLLTEPEPWRFGMHGLLRDYARALCSAEALQAAHARHFEYYHGQHSDYDANNDEDRHPVLAADWENVMGAIQWGFEQDIKRVVDWVWAIQYFMDLRRTHAERLDLLQRTLQAAQGIDYQWGQANTLKAMGDVHRMQSETGVAEGYYKQALPLYGANGDSIGQANTLRAMGDVRLSQNKTGAAEGYYEQAQALYGANGDSLGQAHALRSIGDVQLSQNEYGAAEGYYEQALVLYRAVGDRLGQAHTLFSMGDVQLSNNEHGAAEGYYEQALVLYRAVGDRLGQANTLQALGDVRLRQSEYRAAVGYYEQALPLYGAIGSRLGQANTLQALGDVRRREGQYTEAIAFYQQALSLGAQIGDFTAQLNSLMGLAFAYHAQGADTAACASARQLLALADSHEFFRGHPVVAVWRREFAGWGCG